MPVGGDAAKEIITDKKSKAVGPLTNGVIPGCPAKREID
jgi:hypothetical protein